MDVQILDWRANDIILSNEDDDEDSDSSEDAKVSTSRKYDIVGFGMNEQGESVCVKINDYTPFFYIKCKAVMTTQDVESIRSALVDIMPFNFKNDIKTVKVLKKKDLWGFSNHKVFPFLRIVFANILAMKICAKALLRAIKVRGKMTKFELYESNIEPFIRFLHCKNINPSGWIRVQNDPAYKHVCQDNTTCTHYIATHWKNVESLPSKEMMAPWLIASVDIECTSSHGDFPLAKKAYEKVSYEMIAAYNEKKLEPKVTTSMIKQFIQDSLFVIFNFPDEHIQDVSVKKLYSAVHFKQPYSVHPNQVMDIVEDVLLVLNERVNTNVSAEVLYELDDTEVFKKRFKQASVFTKNKTKSKMNPEDKIKESAFVQLNALLSGNFPSVEGDAIIQIGTTFHRYGQTECHMKKIITLDTCDAIPGTDVITCKTETQVLLEWSKMIQALDPDIITGYNIFGFDMQFMYDRSEEIDCTEQFCRLGRYKNRSCEIVHKCLSSSALGDNFLHYIDMEGRITIDLMKVVQRDHNLDSYKLDSVASHFIRGNITRVDGNMLTVDNTNGLQEKSYINLIADDEQYKVYIQAIDFETKQVEVDIFVESYSVKKWGLAKDDVSPNEIFRCQKGSSADRAKIAKYCVQDCALCNALIIKLEIIANNIGMSNVCCVPLSYIFMRGQGVKIFSLVSKQCRLDNTLIPVLKKIDENEIDEGYEGAIVLNPKPGIYVNEPISVMDYASLYPSSMISENISHDSLVIDPVYDNLPGVNYVDITYDTFEGIGDKKKKTGEMTSRFAQFPNNEKGVLPRILQHLLKKRKETRKRIETKKITLSDHETIVIGLVQHTDDHVIQVLTEDEGLVEVDKEDVLCMEDYYNEFMKAVLDGLQLAYKVTANSLYGQVGARTSAIFMKELAASTTATGRDLILKAKKFMEDKYDADVIYGDTDSIFVSFRLHEKEGLSGTSALKKSIELSCAASGEFKKAHLKAPHDLEYEKTFYPFIILSKKRYVGNLYEFNVNKFKQKSMGIVLKRRDNANIVKYVYGGMIDIILNEKDIHKAVTFLKTALKDLTDGKFPLDQLVITKTLKGTYKDPSKIAHKVLADRMGERDPGSKPQINDRIPYIYIVNKDKNALQGNKIEDPEYITENNIKPDYAFYISNQLMKPIAQLLALELEKIPGYTKTFDPGYYHKKEEALMNEHKRDQKKVNDKLGALRMDEIINIIFKPILKPLEMKNNGNKTILECYHK